MALDLHPALTATGRFDVRRCLGSGGFGVVYEVHDAEANARVALKWLRNSDASTLARFKREFRSLSDLTHPNLVGFRELITVGGEWFFTMDLVDGVDLLRYVRPASPVDAESKESTATGLEGEKSSTVALAAIPPPGRSLRDVGAPMSLRSPEGQRPLCAADLRRLRFTFEQLASGLETLHGAGMLHRDIKPSNVIVGRDGRVVILDLGLVAEVGDDGIALTKTGKIVGTPAYMSPEQAMGAALTPATDWYAVGAILYEALTGKVPFDVDPRAMLVRKRFEDAVSPTEIVRGVPKALAELCLALLAREPEQRPTGAAFVERLREAIPLERAAAPGQPQQRTSALPVSFVGREAHLWALTEALDETERGKSVVALVHGTSGMGKTALVRHFLDGLRKTRPEIVLLEGRCYERESVPYKALDSLVDSLCRYVQRLPAVEAAQLLPRDLEALARVFPVFLELDVAAKRRGRARIDAVAERRRAFEALRELLARVADRSPVVLFIDDLQWGDGDSEPLLLTLLRAPDPPPVLLVAAYRTEDESNAPLVRALRNLVAAGGPVETCEIPIGELSPEASHDLAGALLGDGADARLVDALAREACGSPLFLRQLAALGFAEQKIDLATALCQRVAALPEEARRFLETLAVSGRPLPLASVARAAGIENDAQGVLAKLRAESLVRTRGVETRDEVEIYHDRIREVVVASLTEEQLRALHRKLGRVLSASGDADAEALATHFSAADERTLAAEYAEQAADRASQALAFARAAEMYELALGYTSSEGRSAETLVTKLAEALANAGRGGDAAERFLQAADAASPVDALELRRRAAEQYLFSGHIDEGLQVVERILDAMKMSSPKTPIGAVFSLLWRRFILWLRGVGFRERSADAIAREHLVRIDTCFSVGLGLGMVDPVRGADFQTRYLLLALKAGEPLRIAKGFALEAAYRAGDGVKATPVIERLLARAMTLAERVGQAHAIGLTMLMSGVSRVLLGDYEKGLVLCDKAYAELDQKCVGVAWELDNAAFFAGFSLLGRGRVSELSRRLPGLLEDARTRGDLYGEILLRLQCAWFVGLAVGDAAGARGELAALPETWSRGRFLLQNAWQLVNSVDVELYEGNGRAAWQQLVAGWPKLKKSMYLRAQTMRVRMANARGRAALGAARDLPAGDPERRELLALVSRIARELAPEEWPLARGWRLLLEVGVLLLEGTERARALDRLREAIVELDARGALLYAASARLRLGQLLGGDEGAALVARATKELADEGIAYPERMAAAFVPVGPD